MDDQQQDILLEELRKLRGEVRALRYLLFNGIIMLAVITAAVAFEVKWFKESLVGTALGAGFVWLGWLAWQLHRAIREARKKKVPARLVITLTQPVVKP